MQLIDRRSERSLLDEVLRDVKSGRSRVMMLLGEPGVGKSALLDYMADRAPDCLVVRAAGVESEMELAYAALHQLCMPLRDRVDHLAAPQREALSVAFGLTTGQPPDRLLISLAVLSLLSEAAESRPVICLIDDLQWLDDASAQALSFVGRRLGAESVALVMASRSSRQEMVGLPRMEINGLPEASA